MAEVDHKVYETEFPGVWCCERRSECRWQGFALHQGLGWGKVRGGWDPWAQAHERECGGKLIQLLPPYSVIR
jgi:hypothetical protein